MKQNIELGNAVLKGVSRSFYISIKLLPRLMREPISVAYLLARASDTLADTEKVPATLRKACLDLFLDALSDETSRQKMLELISSRFVQYQENKREELLLRRLADVFDWYDSVRDWAWKDIKQVLKPIVAGQIWDVTHFGIDEKKQVTDEKSLDNYCYQVAGSVGKFWGDVGVHSYRRFSEFETKKLETLGINYGKGLQLVNILRDLATDLEMGRCYLPDVDMEDKEALLKTAKKHRIQARKYLEDGLVYSSALRQKRAKIATALPAIIGIKTLDLMEEASWEDYEEGIKITRKEMRKSMWHALWY